MSECKWKDCEYHNFETKRFHCQNCGIHIVDLIDNLYADNDQLRESVLSLQTKITDIRNRLNSSDETISVQNGMIEQLHQQLAEEKAKTSNLQKVVDIGTDNIREAWGALENIREFVEDNAPPGSVLNGEYLEPTFSVESLALLDGIAEIVKQLKAEQAKSAELEKHLAGEVEAKNSFYNDLVLYKQSCDELVELKEKLYSQVDEQQATIAAMRSALEVAKPYLDMAAQYRNLIKLGVTWDDPAALKVKRLIDKALSNTAGAEYAELRKRNVNREES